MERNCERLFGTYRRVRGSCLKHFTPRLHETPKATYTRISSSTPWSQTTPLIAQIGIGLQLPREAHRNTCKLRAQRAHVNLTSGGTNPTRHHQFALPRHTEISSSSSDQLFFSHSMSHFKVPKTFFVSIDRGVLPNCEGEMTMYPAFELAKPGHHDYMLERALSLSIYDAYDHTWTYTR